MDVFSLLRVLWWLLPPQGISSDDDEEDRKASVDARHEVQAKAYRALGQAWPLLSSTQGVLITLTQYCQVPFCYLGVRVRTTC